MKKKLLIILLCTLSVAAFAQKAKPKAGAKTPGKKTTAPNKNAGIKNAGSTTQQAANNNAANKPVPPPVQQQPSVTDTTKKQAAVPAKPFERPLDGYYKKSNILSARVTPYANLRESDVVFSKRLWQEIDVREKSNTYLASPKSRLIDVLMDAVMAGELTAYDPNPTKDDPGGDMFTKPLKPEEAKGRMADSSLVEKRDSLNNVIKSNMVAGEFNPDSIVRFRIKEDWMFDKQRSVFEPRIIGIAPLIKPKATPGVELDLQPAFWIYFPEARQVLATKEVVNRDNDATGLSFDDVFMKRLFTAYVVKQSNNKDERIKDYAQGIDRLYESQRIKKTLMDWELDLWQY
ncbi:gliding motility protein GldN [Mucilaginibacter mali]|uniref:Gliding motility protein GldN n=1 Tax=Mucilaginibacter mali TaxID=2740462 RepID=A0A7D4TPU9_9SPHI|nr:gliding motility protein GldN [Mucilaginibacter mali]QKJ30974.1 gliding motility protein GldN [Mucilaginibacter mali]